MCPGYWATVTQSMSSLQLTDVYFLVLEVGTPRSNSRHCQNGKTESQFMEDCFLNVVTPGRGVRRSRILCKVTNLIHKGASL